MSETHYLPLSGLGERCKQAFNASDSECFRYNSAPAAGADPSGPHLLWHRVGHADCADSDVWDSPKAFSWPLRYDNPPGYECHAVYGG